MLVKYSEYEARDFGELRRNRDAARSFTFGAGQSPRLRGKKDGLAIHCSCSLEITYGISDQYGSFQVQTPISGRLLKQAWPWLAASTVF